MKRTLLFLKWKIQFAEADRFSVATYIIEAEYYGKEDGSFLGVQKAQPKPAKMFT